MRIWKTSIYAENSWRNLQNISAGVKASLQGFSVPQNMLWNIKYRSLKPLAFNHDWVLCLNQNAAQTVQLHLGAKCKQNWYLSKSARVCWKLISYIFKWLWSLVLCIQRWFIIIFLNNNPPCFLPFAFSDLELPSYAMALVFASSSSVLPLRHLKVSASEFAGWQIPPHSINVNKVGRAFSCMSH